MVAASALLLSFVYKPSVFPEINPVIPYIPTRKILPVGRSSDSQS